MQDCRYYESMNPSMFPTCGRGGEWDVNSKPELYPFFLVPSTQTSFLCVRIPKYVACRVFLIPHTVQRVEISFPSFQDRGMGFRIGQLRSLSMKQVTQRHRRSWRLPKVAAAELSNIQRQCSDKCPAVARPVATLQTHFLICVLTASGCQPGSCPFYNNQREAV